MNEDALWKSFKEKVGPYGRLERIENSLKAGIPDVCYLLRRYPRVPPICGWLELKYEESYTKKGLILRQLTKEQVLWQEDWVEQGGVAYTLARVGDDHYLLKPFALRHIFTSPLSKSKVVSLATGYWEGPIIPSEMIKCLTRT